MLPFLLDDNFGSKTKTATTAAATLASPVARITKWDGVFAGGVVSSSYLKLAANPMKCFFARHNRSPRPTLPPVKSCLGRVFFLWWCGFVWWLWQSRTKWIKRFCDRKKNKIRERILCLVVRSLPSLSLIDNLSLIREPALINQRLIRREPGSIGAGSKRNDEVELCKFVSLSLLLSQWVLLRVWPPRFVPVRWWVEPNGRKCLFNQHIGRGPQQDRDPRSQDGGCQVLRWLAVVVNMNFNQRNQC